MIKFDTLFEKFLQSVNLVKLTLVISSLVFSFILIMLDNSGVFPLALEDFLVFSALAFLFALYRPGWAFLFFIGLIPFEIVNLAPVEMGMMLRPYQWAGILTLAAVATRFFSGRLPFSLPKMHRLDWALLVFWLGSLLAALDAPMRGADLKQSIILFSFIALYALTRVFVRTVADVKNIVAFFAGSGFAVVSYALWQNIRFAHGNISFEVMAGRPNSVFTEPDWMGVFLTVCIGALYAALYAFRRDWRMVRKTYEPLRKNRKAVATEGSNRVRMFYSLHAALVLIYIGLIVSVSRSAWLAVGVMTVLVGLFVLIRDGWFDPRRWQWAECLRFAGGVTLAFVASLTIVIMLHLTTFQLFNRAQSTASGLQRITVACERETVLPEKIASADELASSDCRHITLEEKRSIVDGGGFVTEIYRNDPNVDIRKSIYGKTADIIREHALLGIGFGSIGSFLGNDERGAGLNASNIFLEVWLGAGLIGLAAFLLLWFRLGLVAIRRSFARTKNDDLNAVYLFIALSWIGLTVFNLFNAGIFLGFFWVWLAVAVSFIRKKV